VLVSRVPVLLSGIHSGDVVVFDHPSHGKMIKIVKRLDQDNRSAFVVGTNPDSVDSRMFGPVPYHMVLGKVIWHIARSRR